METLDHCEPGYIVPFDNFQELANPFVSHRGRRPTVDAGRDATGRWLLVTSFSHFYRSQRGRMYVELGSSWKTWNGRRPPAVQHGSNRRSGRGEHGSPPRRVAVPGASTLQGSMAAPPIRSLLRELSLA